MKLKWGGAGVALAAVVAAVAAALSGGGSSTTAHLWVDTTGGACTREVSQAEYSDAAACSSFDVAWDAASAGDTIRVAAGTYPDQRITGDKASETFIIGATGVTVSAGASGSDCTNAWAAICADAAEMTLENVTAETADPGPAGGASIGAANVTFRDVTLRGEVSADGYYAPSLGVYAAGFTWEGGNLGRAGEVATATCDHATMEPLWFQSGGDNATIDGITIYPYDPKVAAGANCGVDNTPHIETIRLEDADDVTIKNSYFDTDGGDHGSGHVFTSSDPDNFRLINNRIGPRGTNAWMQCNGCTGTGWLLAYNTITETGGVFTPGSSTQVGNFGEASGCWATNIASVYDGAGSCGSNTYIGATSFGLDANLKLEAGSPAIDAAETPGASDHCTDATSVASVDFEGTVRPQGSVCDAGADER